MTSTNEIRIVQYGLGPIGQACVRTILSKEHTGRLRLVGAIDIDPEKTGHDVADLVGHTAPTGVVISGEAEQTLAEVRPDVVLHTTTSFMEGVEEQLLESLRAGAHVVSSTEELAYPFERHPDLSATLDREARAHGVVLVGTGVNPGYAMDTLALMATGACVDVTVVEVERVVDAAQRRAPLQRKIGAGLSAEAFEEKKATGTFGHIGLRESLLMVADGLGWPLERIAERLDPVRADHCADTGYLTVQAGEVAGIDQEVVGYVGGEAVLTLALRMYVGAERSYDAVHVTGDPPIDLVVRGGIFGDTATVATLINTAALVRRARPGLRTMKELPVPRAFATTPVRAAVPAAEEGQVGS